VCGEKIGRGSNSNQSNQGDRMTRPVVNQPGYFVDQVLVRTHQMLQDLSAKYNVMQTQMQQRRPGN
jgi:hypothetical protein